MAGFRKLISSGVYISWSSFINTLTATFRPLEEDVSVPGLDGDVLGGSI